MTPGVGVCRARPQAASRRSKFKERNKGSSGSQLEERLKSATKAAPGWKTPIECGRGRARRETGEDVRCRSEQPDTPKGAARQSVSTAGKRLRGGPPKQSNVTSSGQKWEREEWMEGKGWSGKNKNKPLETRNGFGVGRMRVEEAGMQKEKSPGAVEKNEESKRRHAEFLTLFVSCGSREYSWRRSGGVAREETREKEPAGHDDGGRDQARA
ncbi:hypothetical protein GGX14DRAFT_383770 [Mycena pura]|uniref:Uncharacterized protein n=1 Tax=Mycena pura TaxID=153505 RepID=A0AAD6YUY0_9AGAR|nr:hypothetical protein GGX14DRAFT_383770 [Mycena pura]